MSHVRECDQCGETYVPANGSCGCDSRKLNEHGLPDDYPLHVGYLYVVDGKVVQAIERGTVAEWKRRRGCKVVTSCDISGRDLWHLAV